MTVGKETVIYTVVKLNTITGNSSDIEAWDNKNAAQKRRAILSAGVGAEPNVTLAVEDRKLYIAVEQDDATDADLVLA